jgi:hypothetical protein
MTHTQKKNIGYFEFWDRAGLKWNPEEEETALSAISSLRRLAPKFHRQCENSCNGAGWINGKIYYAGTIDDYAKREYGSFVKSAYTMESDKETGENVFDREIDRLTREINIKLGMIPGVSDVVFQHDPRGWEISFNINGFNASGLIYN